MCGIFGYIGNEDAAQTIREGLERLEYRGYDSWGIAVAHEEHIVLDKHVGPMAAAHDTTALPQTAKRGIGHTRWATHGGVTDTNAHPHFSSDGRFALAQNGIVENYQELKRYLVEEGYSFQTETDTEIIVRLIELELTRLSSESFSNQLKHALQAAFLQLKGRNTVIVLNSKANQTLAIKNGSPLVIGLGDGEVFISSDTLSFAHKTNKVIVADNFQMFEALDGDIQCTDVRDGSAVPYKVETLEHAEVSVDKDGYDYYMLKEIIEQQHTLSEAVSYSQEDLEGIINVIRQTGRVFTLGAGGAFLVSDQIAYLLRTIGKVDAIGIRAYEIEAYAPLISDGDVVIVISQSGETGDNLEALEYLDTLGKKVRLASVVNMMGSTTSRLSEFAFMSRSGPELCVLSTKSGTAQVAFGYLLAQSLAGNHDAARTDVDDLSTYLKDYLSESLLDSCRRVAQTLATSEHVFILGKGRNYQVANLGALNIKEASYVHAEGFSAGELKHGVIALIEKRTPIICFVDNDEHRDYMFNVAAEVKSRGAHVIGVGVEENELFDDFVPLPTQSNIEASHIVNVIPGQLIAYFTAVTRGLNPDRPRNLAKAVTVK